MDSVMNLDEIIEQATGEKIDLMYSGEVKDMKECMRIAVKQALKLAAERAKADYDDAYITDEEGEEWIGVGKPYVVKSSILSIIEEIE